MMSTVRITEAAQGYLAELLGKQDSPGMGIRIFVTQPGTPYAESCLAYCRPGEEKPDDEALALKDFTVWVDATSQPFLEEAEVDYAADRMGGQLTIRAPSAKVPMISEDSPLPERVNYYLQTEINPGLADHGGQVSLVEIVEDGIAVLRFGGGCQGCSMVDATLKEGVEKTLLARVPELKGVRDMTDHSQRDNAYL